MFIVLNIAGYDDDNGVPMHPLRIRVREHFKGIESEALKKFRRAWEKQGKPSYWMLFLGIHSEGTLGTIPPEIEAVNEEYQQMKHKEWLKELATKAQAVIDELNLEDYYSSEMEKEYEHIADDLRIAVKEYKVGDVLNRFWGMQIPADALLIPMPLESCNRAGAGRIPNYLVTVAGPRCSSPTAKPEFPGSCVFSIIHECSHHYAHEVMKLCERYLLFVNKCASLYSVVQENEAHKPESDRLTDMYGIAHSLIEEHLVRAAEIVFISPVLAKGHMSQVEIERNRDWTLDDVRKQGFMFLDVFIEAIRSTKDNKKRMTEALFSAVETSYSYYAIPDKCATIPCYHATDHEKKQE